MMYKSYAESCLMLLRKNGRTLIKLTLSIACTKDIWRTMSSASGYLSHAFFYSLFLVPICLLLHPQCGRESARDDSYLDIPLVIRPFGSDRSYESVVRTLMNQRHSIAIISVGVAHLWFHSFAVWSSGCFCWARNLEWEQPIFMWTLWYKVWCAQGEASCFDHCNYQSHLLLGLFHIKLTFLLQGLKFTSFPYILTLQLKRFDFDYVTMHRIKLNDR